MGVDADRAIDLVETASQLKSLPARFQVTSRRHNMRNSCKCSAFQHRGKIVMELVAVYMSMTVYQELFCFHGLILFVRSAAKDGRNSEYRYFALLRRRLQHLLLQW
jgi:hypothetical protein